MSSDTCSLPCFLDGRRQNTIPLSPNFVVLMSASPLGSFWIPASISYKVKKGRSRTWVTKQRTSLPSLDTVHLLTLFLHIHLFQELQTGVPILSQKSTSKRVAHAQPLCQVFGGFCRVRGEPEAGYCSQKTIPAGLIETSGWKLNPVEEIKCAGVTLAEAFVLSKPLLKTHQTPSTHSCGRVWGQRLCSWLGAQEVSWGQFKHIETKGAQLCAVPAFRKRANLKWRGLHKGALLVHSVLTQIPKPFTTSLNLLENKESKIG